MSGLSVTAAQERVIRQALRVLSAEREDSHAHHHDDLALAGEQLALAARDLVRAVDALPGDDQPASWDDACTTCGTRIPTGQLFVTPGGVSMCIPCATEDGGG